MKKQVIISIGREYGSGGRKIAEALAERYGLALYGKNIIDIVAEEKGFNAAELKKYDEKARNVLFSRSVDGLSNSPEDAVAKMQFDYLKEKSDSGQSFIVLGRCASYILRDNPGIIKIFITGDTIQKINTIALRENVDAKTAEELMLKRNRKRKSYHNYYSKEKWGDSRYYDLIINSSKLPIEETIDIIDRYIQKRVK